MRLSTFLEVLQSPYVVVGHDRDGLEWKYLKKKDCEAMMTKQLTTSSTRES